MSSDRERDSLDLAQQYRKVVAQQGRVTLASDANEAWDLFDEMRRAQLNDIVGPFGTPDNGYAVSYFAGAAQNDFAIGKGTMYLGGERVELLKDMTYLGQGRHEWLDDFPQGVKMPVPVPAQAWLLVREQEVSAVEDPTLLEVALGGPDTTQRTRFIQHVVTTAVTAADCPAAWNEVLTAQKQLGYDFDGKRMRFLPWARLQVGIAETKPQTDPCEPASTGGYLGAENQCIRVMVTDHNPATGAVKLVWAYDNAHHLFKVDVDKGRFQLTLSAPPVDSFHWPRTGQAAEVLQSAAELANGSRMAQALGQVSVLASDYDADERTVQLSTALSDPPFPSAAAKPVYMRLWEQQLDAQVGQAIVLGSTGLQVTLSAVGNNAIAPGSFWVFAVRPAAPQEVYPGRFLAAPQAPDGPRLWGCPLAILNGAGATPPVTDCRACFDNLVELTKRRKCMDITECLTCKQIRNYSRIFLILLLVIAIAILLVAWFGWYCGCYYKLK